jgi:hypothetical protein
MTDRIDVLMLMRGLIGYEGGDARIWRVVTVPSIDEEDRKRQHRESRILIAKKGRHTNRVKGMLAQEGVYDYEPALSTPGAAQSCRCSVGSGSDRSQQASMVAPQWAVTTGAGSPPLAQNRRSAAMAAAASS